MADMRRFGDIVYSHSALMSAREKMNAWLERESVRLGYQPDEIIDAIRERAWLADEIEALTVANADQLDGPPLRVRAVAERLRNAPILPVVRDTENRGRRREMFVARSSPYRSTKAA